MLGLTTDSVEVRDWRPSALRRYSPAQVGPLIAVGLLAALPVIVSTLHALSVAWVPLGDDAVIALRSYDVLSSHPPLVGQFSASSVLAGEPTYSLGPMLYWLLAIPGRLGGAGLLAVTVGLVNAASAVGIVVLARRRGGTALMFVAAVALVVMCRSLDGRTFSDIWNPAAGLLPFVLLVFLAWSLACGEVRLMPLVVLVTSFVVQCHLMYLLPAAAVLAVAAAALMVRRKRRERDFEAARPWLVATLVVGLLCWSAPLVDQAIHRPGNLVAIAEAVVNNDETIGVDAGTHAIVHAVGVPPNWLRETMSTQERVLAQSGPLDGASVFTTVLLLLALVALLLVAVRHRRPGVVVPVALALFLCVALVLVASSTPSDAALSISAGYTLWTASPIGMFAWLVLGLGLATLTILSPLPLLRRTEVRAALVAVGVLVASASLVDAGPGPDRARNYYEPARALDRSLQGALQPGQTALVESGGGSAGFAERFDFQTFIVYALRRHGVRPLAPQLAAPLGGRYADEGAAVDATVRVANATDPRPTGAQVLARIDIADPNARALVVTLHRGGP